MPVRQRQELSSPRHPLLRRLRAALREGELTPEGCCALEGAHLVEEALRSPSEVVALVAARSATTLLERFEAASGGRVPSYVVPDRLFRSLAQTETPQGIAALVRLPDWELEKCLASPGALVVALVELQDPGNLGTILRAVETFGGAACLLALNTVSPFNAKAARASAGSLFRVPVFRRLAVEKIVDACRTHGLHTLGLVPRGGLPLKETDLTPPTAFFVGQEGAGLPAGVLAQLDAMASIPLAAPVDSLNAAMAATLALYEARRQRDQART